METERKRKRVGLANTTPKYWWHGHTLEKGVKGQSKFKKKTPLKEQKKKTASGGHMSTISGTKN